MPRLPVIHQRRMLHEGTRFPVEELELEFSNGVRRTYERVPGSGRGAVLVVPRDQSQRVREAAAWYDEELAK